MRPFATLGIEIHIVVIGAYCHNSALIASGEALGRARPGGRPTLACDEKLFINTYWYRSAKEIRKRQLFAVGPAVVHL
jgi:hypothetical protein